MALQIPLEIQERLAEHLDWMKITPERVLDLGYGAGLANPLLEAAYPRAWHLALDSDPHCLPRPPRWNPLRFLGPNPIGGIAGRAEAIPLQTASVDLVHSNLLLPCVDAPAMIREVARILKPGGLFLWSSLGPDSFRELRALGVDFKPFMDMHDLGDLLLECGLSNPVVNREDLVFTYGDRETLREDLTGWGWEYYLQAHPDAANWHHALEGLKGELNLSLEALFGHAWKPLPPKGLEGKRIIPINAPR
jgi:malonyl-CoA O-methyltransferase